MNKRNDAKRVMNGTWGEVWLEGNLIAEIYKFQAKDSYTRDNVPMCGSLMDGKKLTKIERTGSLGMYHVRSRMLRLIGDKIRAGNDPEFTIVSKLDDPDAYGAERIAFSGVKFADLTLMDWEAGVLGKIECPFTFQEYEFLDLVPEG